MNVLKDVNMSQLAAADDDLGVCYIDHVDIDETTDLGDLSWSVEILAE